MAHDALVLEEIDAFYGDSHVLYRVSLRLGEGRLLDLLGRGVAHRASHAVAREREALAGRDEGTQLRLSELPNATAGTASLSAALSGKWFELVAKEKVRKQRFVTVREPWTTGTTSAPSSFIRATLRACRFVSSSPI